MSPEPRSRDSPAWAFEYLPVTARDERVTVSMSGNFAANNSEAALAQGKLVRVLPEWQPVGAFAETIYAIRPYTPHVPRAVAALVESLRRGLAGGFGV